MGIISFINKKTFEIQDELEDYIYCDYEIRNIIADLYEKGYETNFSCAGHNETGLLWPTHRLPIADSDKYLEESKYDKALHFISKDDEYFYHKDEKVAAYIYISFKKAYNFKSFPKNFIYELVDNTSYISKKINFYKDKNHENRKSDNEINSELESSRLDLKKWVAKLSKNAD